MGYTRPEQSEKGGVMRKKIFIIHGKGVNRGIGKEGGGDLDTVSSNTLYAVWAQNALREELGREPEYGKDYEFDFINYSEGISHLAVHEGCDVYLPDFPIDALPARLRMLVIEEKEAISLLNRYTEELNDFKLWITKNAGRASEEAKALFNVTFNQLSKVLEHQERAPLLMALQVLDLTRRMVELDVSAQGRDGEDAVPLRAAIQGMMEVLCGHRLAEMKKALKDQLDDKTKEKMVDRLIRQEPLPKDDILDFDRAIAADMSTRGRVNYTDELLIVAMEVVAYVVRGLRQLRDFPFIPELANAFRLGLEGLVEEIRRPFQTLANLVKPLAEGADESVRRSAEGINAACGEAAELLDGIASYVPPKRTEGDFPVRAMIIEEGRGVPVSGIEIEVRRLKGEGPFLTEDGREVGAESVTLVTDESGTVEVFYRPAAPGEDYLLSVTFDDLNYTLLPTDIRPPDNVMDLLFDEAEDEAASTTFDEEGAEVVAPPDRAMRMALTVLERQIRDLHEKDIRIVSIDDHHPYTPEIMDLLKRLQKEGLLGDVHVASLPRGEELEIEKQKCGCDLIYTQRIEEKPWDNPGLAELRRIAHLQDLHIEPVELALDISKLIGSKFSKVEMALTIAERVKDIESMRNIMGTTGWDEKVRLYEEGLEKVLPRTEQVLGHLRFRRKSDEGTVHVLAAMSPFCDPKKGETTINAAACINYLIERKKYPADYFFYCFGSHLMSTRKPNMEEPSIDLSTLCQHIGTKSDGGHSGAATCKPATNPTFPLDRLLKLRDTNFLEHLEYLAAKVVEYNPGLALDAVLPVPVERYPEPVERALKHLRETTYEIRIERKDDPSGVLTVLFTRAPKVNYRAREKEQKPSFFQVLNYLKRHLKADVLVFSQGMMYRVILARMGEGDGRIDLPALARSIGWEVDGGRSGLAVADIKKNPKVKKRLRRLLNPHVDQLARFVGRCIEEATPYRVVSIRPLLFGGVMEEWEDVLRRMEKDALLCELKPKAEGNPSLRVLATLAPRVSKVAGEADPSLPLVAEKFKELKPDCLLHTDWQITTIKRLEGAAGPIDCTAAAAAIAEKRFCGDGEVAEFMTKGVEGSPLRGQPAKAANHRPYVEFLLEKIGERTGYEVASIRPAAEISG